MQEETILFELNLAETKTIHREDIEDLWNVLRIRGTITINDIPETIRAEGVDEWLFDFLGNLDYVRPIQIFEKKEILRMGKAFNTFHSQNLFLPRKSMSLYETLA